jgi:lysophosphatidate acyltransferase
VIGRATQVAKKEILYLFPFGFACWLWGTLFINRQNHTSAMNKINSESKAINEKKVSFFIEFSVCIFVYVSFAISFQ